MTCPVGPPQTEWMWTPPLWGWPGLLTCAECFLFHITAEASAFWSCIFSPCCLWCSEDIFWVKSISRDGERFAIWTSSLEQIWHCVLRTTNSLSPFDLVIPFLEISSEKITSIADKSICTKMFFVELFVRWKKISCETSCSEWSRPCKYRT